MTDLGTLGGTSSGAYGINNSGQIVGNASIAGNTAAHAFLYSGGIINDLGILDGATSSFAFGINNSGQVVGFSETVGDNTANRAFLYTNGAMLDLNSLISADSGWALKVASAINDSGQIIGSGIINGQTHAFLMTPVPIPAAFWLFGSGLVGLFGFMRRGRSQRIN